MYLQRESNHFVEAQLLHPSETRRKVGLVGAQGVDVGKLAVVLAQQANECGGAVSATNGVGERCVALGVGNIRVDAGLEHETTGRVGTGFGRHVQWEDAPVIWILEHNGAHN